MLVNEPHLVFPQRCDQRFLILPVKPTQERVREWLGAGARLLLPTACKRASGQRVLGYRGLVVMRTRSKRSRGSSHSVSEKQTAGLPDRVCGKCLRPCDTGPDTCMGYL